MADIGITNIERLCSLPANNSFFLFGARGTGKTTLLKRLPFLEKAFYIDLLNNDSEEKYAMNPQLLMQQVRAMKDGDWVIIDEIQKNPKLLNHVHILIEERNIKFALTGSSSRKLKRGGADLLAGRARSFSLSRLLQGSWARVSIFSKLWNGVPCPKSSPCLLPRIKAAS
ncbi:MAG TPA: hypothetical protein DIC34_14625 [Treponema sp.]|nr:MAG: hypothetical protein A2001_10515 [Treponema sp. GWC1_61_84]OHE65602.1 MAG: hypothetical protein A2Y36_06725 [Treponema sp. GWA1_62_8]OHE72692.1 MAG: hypothetical protein A2413_12380 [Treponema sp. RIFOXYC1_FULL_61_9]HCM27755.1 hypothetical protein [Treponema sp.]